jgi:threonine dehydrogenase-like Zn-dependent dehydrogenase
MRSAVVEAPGRVRVKRVPPPAPGPSQVLVRIEGCGVCGSNLPLYEGRQWFHYPCEPGHPGHEGWGVVEEVGPRATGVRPGQRVALLSSRAFAELDLAEATEVVALPAELDGRPFPAEPLACAVNVFARAGVAAGQTVAVVGIGFLGALLTSLASRAGARVVAVSRRPFALEVARRFGAEEALSLDDAEGTEERLLELTGGQRCARVVECVGRQEALDLAARLTGVRGRLVIAGYHQDGPRTVDLQLWNWRGFDVVNAHERDPAMYVRGLRQAIAAVVAGQLDPAPLLTHSFPLEGLGEALELARRRPAGFMKSWVRA